tara:strand:+ start:70 stop:483 length:414 start_codon:yes stop_codon:yes gene_type:complete
MERIIEKTFISWVEIKERIKPLIEKYGYNAKCYGIPRGGQFLAPFFDPVDTIEEADFIIDDLIESGATKKRYLKYDKPFEALFDKQTELQLCWLVFPWEKKEEPVYDNFERLCQHNGIQSTERLYKKVLKTLLNEKG